MLIVGRESAFRPIVASAAAIERRAKRRVPDI
jgi:hypothetical protein